MRKSLLVIALLASFNVNATLFCDSDNNPGAPVQWHKGQSVDALRTLSFDTGVSCFATGVELDYILTHFGGLRTRSNATFVNWYGDDAQFIVGNL